MPLHKNVDVSIRKGAIFKFKVDEKEVVYTCAPLSGKEKVTIDGVIVSEGQNFKLSSTHYFSVNDKDYSVEFRSKSLINGDAECRLFTEDSLVNGYKLSYIKPAKRSLLFKSLPLIGGVCIGIAYSIRLIPVWLAAAMLIVGIAIHVSKDIGKWTCDEISV